VRILATTVEKRKSPRIRVRWPITVLCNRCLIEGESRNITANGILARFKEPLHENGTYRVGIDFNDTFSDMAFYFVELDEEDRSLLNEAVSAQLT
jgi:hypothetical protein